MAEPLDPVLGDTHGRSLYGREPRVVEKVGAGTVNQASNGTLPVSAHRGDCTGFYLVSEDAHSGSASLLRVASVLDRAPPLRGTEVRRDVGPLGSNRALAGTKPA